MRRRDLLKSSLPVLAGTVVAGGLTGEILDAEPIDPHVEWFERYSVLRKDMNSDPDDIENGDPRTDECLYLEAKTGGTPAQTVQGLLAQAGLAAHPDFGLIDGSYSPAVPPLLNNITMSLRALV
ncbi:hypothetical protein [Ruegeria jejuensis]|uniref:hypothetical protein n=1 Tax=Ruegeria jejuensis TaxID=3233338 RepID=UPI00355C4079